MRARLAMIAAVMTVAACSMAEAGPFKLLKYVEDDQPDVRVSGVSPIAGLSLEPTQSSAPATAPGRFWVKLPPGFIGQVTIEVTSHDHDFHATAIFEGVAEGGWQQLPDVPDGAVLPRMNLHKPEIAIRGWLASTSDAQTRARRLALVRWNAVSPDPQPAGEVLRVRLNLGNAAEAGAWLDSGPGRRVPARCQPLSGRTHVYFRWICVFDPAPVAAELGGAKLLIARRERDGREQFESISPNW